MYEVHATGLIRRLRVTQRAMEKAMIGVLEVEWCSAQVNAALVGPQRGGQTTSYESLGAAVNKRLRTVDFGTPYKRSMSSSGLQSVEVLMMMISWLDEKLFD
ncbi:jg4279 [Pararge aegeria aegeria]|uniref:Jg4279 protein n=1 Tax=Pararge aegeria aegeria TaxID=348720 RepID=A0A8S4QUL5_9NEOP|nr:jg4279 [Pararge aegeria aegeria]